MDQYRTIVIADHHKKPFVARIIDRESGEIRSMTLTSQRSEISPFLDDLTGPAVLFVEACRAWEWLADLCNVKGVDLRLVNPNKMPEISRSWKKTDAHDVAAMVNRYLAVGELPECYVASREEREVRGLTRRLSELRHARRDILFRIHAFVDSHGSPGNKTLFLKDSWRESLKMELTPDAWLVADSLFTELDQKITLTTTLEARVEELMKEREDAKRLQVIPGIGWVLAATILAEAGDIHRFKTARSFAAYSGVVPRVSSSAGVAHYGHITRAGPRDLRWALGQAAMIGLRCKIQTDVSRFYYRKARKAKAKKIAITAAAHKLARVIHAVLTKNEPFRTNARKSA